MCNRHNEFAEIMRNIMISESSKHTNLKEVVFESVTCISVTGYIDISDSPIEIVRKFIDENPIESEEFFSNRKAIDQFLEENFPEFNSLFALIDLEENLIKANWRFLLRNQLGIMEEMKKIEEQGKKTIFVLSISCYCC